MWKEMAVAYFKVLSQNLHKTTNDDENVSFRIVSFWVEILTQDLTNTK